MSRSEPARPTASASRWLVVLAWGLWALAMLIVAAIGWLDLLLRQAAWSELAQLSTGAVPFVLAVLSAATVGAVLASRRPRHPVGWLLHTLGLSVAASGVAGSYTAYGVLVRPGSLPAARYAPVFIHVDYMVWLTCLGFIMLLTPTGSLPSPRWRWWARVAVALGVVAVVSNLLQDDTLDPPLQSVPNPIAVPELAGLLTVVAVVTATATNLGVLVGAASLVVRFRRSCGVARQQLRWVAFAAALSASAVIVAVAGAFTENPALTTWAAGTFIAVLPLGVAAAILRYRLYDLDRIISRTLAYGLLTVILGAGYAGVVLGLGQVLGRGGSSLAVAGATLAVAAVFQPARRRIQDLVDRRFNRRRYDAERTIAAFSGRLRQQIDLDALTAELLAVVDQTMQPTSAALWLRPAADRRAGTQGVAEPGGGGTRVPV